MIDLNKIYYCPYCGSPNPLFLYLTKYKNGTYNMKMVKCNDCKIRMKYKTLIVEMSFYEWGRWLYLNIICYRSPNKKFYDNINWEMLKKNLDLLGKYNKMEFWNGFISAKSIYAEKGYDACKLELDKLIDEKEMYINKSIKKSKLSDF